MKFIQPLTLIITALFLLITPYPVSAGSYGLSLNPPLLKVNIRPGKSITQVFTITNLSSDDKFLVARVIPFSETDSRGNPEIDLKKTAPWLSYFSLANSNINLGSPFSIKANASEQLVMSINIPPTAILRDIYATLLVSTYSNLTGLNYQGSLVSATIGSNILITIHPELNPPTLLKINELTPVSGTFFKFGNYYFADSITPISFISSVENSGNFISETKGLFKITGKNDTPVYLEGILPVYVVSNTQRILMNTDGKNFSFNPNLAKLGFHKATIQIKTDNANAESSIDIFFFPFKMSLGLFLALGLLGLIIRLPKPKP